MPAVHRVLHLSDPHLTASGIDMDGVDARAALSGLLHDLRFLEELSLVMVTGDLADDGSVEGVRAVRDMVGQYAAAHGVPHVYATGNHDDRGAFSTVLGSGHLASDGRDVGVPGPLCAAVSEVDGLRVVTLDSLVPGEVHGVVGAEQLEWLAEVLKEPAERGTLVALHHPPVTIRSMPWMETIALQEPDRLGDTLSGTDVRAVLAGHLHHQLSGSLAGIPVSVTPGVVTRIDLTAPQGVERAVLGAGATLVELPQGGTPTFHVLQSRPQGTPVYVVDAVSGVDVADEP